MFKLKFNSSVKPHLKCSLAKCGDWLHHHTGELRKAGPREPKCMLSRKTPKQTARGLGGWRFTSLGDSCKAGSQKHLKLTEVY